MARAYGSRIGYGQTVEVVPVPDEAAIERGAKALAEKDEIAWDWAGEESRNWYRLRALAVLRAALEGE